jgi:hypothetical protein
MFIVGPIVAVVVTSSSASSGESIESVWFSVEDANVRDSHVRYGQWELLGHGRGHWLSSQYNVQVELLQVTIVNECSDGFASG